MIESIRSRRRYGHRLDGRKLRCHRSADAANASKPGNSPATDHPPEVGAGFGIAATVTRGFGKSKPIALNQNPDGTDNADGRQRSRRVEVVINTCN